MNDSKGAFKIFHVITKGTWGGASAHVYDLLTEAVRRDFETTLVFGASGELSEKANSSNIPSIQIPSLVRNVSIARDIKTLFTLYTLFRKEKPDIVHIHSSKAGFTGTLAARFAGCKKIIFTAHGWPHNEKRPEWQKIIFRVFEWLTILFSTHTIVVSDTMYTQAPSFLIHKKLHIIKNGVDSFTLYGKENARTALHLSYPTSTFIFGTIAELHKNKGLDILIHAFKKIHQNYPNAKLCIIGDGEEKNTLKDIIRREKLENDVILLGNIPEAKEYLKAFTVFVLPSRTEALGYVLLEAGLAKTPCIATRVGGIPEIIEHEKTGILVSKEDVRELSMALEFTLTHKQDMEKYAQSLHEKVLTEYTKKEMLEKIFDLYSTPKNS
ncbi:MAG: glycosyltransferase family 4 protein [Minisyncoccia bacterium]